MRVIVQGISTYLTSEKALSGRVVQFCQKVQSAGASRHLYDSQNLLVTLTTLTPFDLRVDRPGASYLAIIICSSRVPELSNGFSSLRVHEEHCVAHLRTSWKICSSGWCSFCCVLDVPWNSAVNSSRRVDSSSDVVSSPGLTTSLAYMILPDLA